MRIRPVRLAGIAALALFAVVGSAGVKVSTPNSVTHSSISDGNRAFSELEKQFDARLGVYAVDTETGKELGYHANDRFAYASTHKAFSSGAVLQQNTIDGLDRRITYSKSDLVENSPITEKHVDTGMTLREVMDAAIGYSDNTAANLLFRELGGPVGLQIALRGIGDMTVHVDRTETDLNRTHPGDIRDTSTPRAMAESLQKLTIGAALPKDKRAILNDMLSNTKYTEELIRAGVPSDWEVGDKSGAADYGTRNDIAVVKPPGHAPIMIAVMSDRAEKDADYDDALIAQAAKVVVDTLR